MVYRVYVEKKPGLTEEAATLFAEATGLLGIVGLESVRVINRYDVENITPELFERAKTTVFSEPAVDNAADTLDCDGGIVFAVEYLPGQFDQRADSAAQCIQLMPSIYTSLVIFALPNNIVKPPLQITENAPIIFDESVSLNEVNPRSPLKQLIRIYLRLFSCLL